MVNLLIIFININKMNKMFRYQLKLTLCPIIINKKTYPVVFVLGSHNEVFVWVFLLPSPLEIGNNIFTVLDYIEK
jgi:hypothetical protein